MKIVNGVDKYIFIYFALKSLLLLDSQNTILVVIKTFLKGVLL